MLAPLTSSSIPLSADRSHPTCHHSRIRMYSHILSSNCIRSNRRLCNLSNTTFRPMEPDERSQQQRGPSLAMLALPNGTFLCPTPPGGSMITRRTAPPNDAWRPTVSQHRLQQRPDVHAHGTQLNGIRGASYGDDAENVEQFPIVRLTNGSNVYYARTATGAAPACRRAAHRSLRSSRCEQPAVRHVSVERGRQRHRVDAGVHYPSRVRRYALVGLANGTAVTTPTRS